LLENAAAPLTIVTDKREYLHIIVVFWFNTCYNVQKESEGISYDYRKRFEAIKRYFVDGNTDSKGTANGQ